MKLKLQKLFKKLSCYKVFFALLVVIVSFAFMFVMPILPKSLLFVLFFPYMIIFSFSLLCILS